MKAFTTETRITLDVNGEDRSVVVRPGDTLAHILRRNLGLTGTKIGCENGDCGACTVLVDDMPVRSCLTLVLDALGRKITTIEGLQDTSVQEAFARHNGFQCGFCTPGTIINAEGLRRNHPDADDKTIRAWMESNTCRCTGYEGIEDSVRAALDSGNIDQQ